MYFILRIDILFLDRYIIEINISSIFFYIDKLYNKIFGNFATIAAWIIYVIINILFFLLISMKDKQVQMNVENN